MFANTSDIRLGPSLRSAEQLQTHYDSRVQLPLSLFGLLIRKYFPVSSLVTCVLRSLSCFPSSIPFASGLDRPVLIVCFYMPSLLTSLQSPDLISGPRCAHVPVTCGNSRPDEGEMSLPLFFPSMNLPCTPWFLYKARSL